MDIKLIFLIFICITGTLAVGLIITNIVFAFMYKDIKLGEDSIIADIQKSLNSKFIYEFHPREKCEEGEEKLILGKWDGTIDKCNCQGNIKNEACTKMDSDCRTITGEKPINYTIFNGKEICVLRKGETFFNLIKSGKIIPKNDNCIETDKSCGIVDTLERKLCIEKNGTCPITRKDIDNVNFQNKDISKILLSGNEYKINFLNEDNEEQKIISIIKLSDGLPCIKPSEKNWKGYYPDEKNITCSAINGKTRDDRYEKFENFQTTKYNLFAENNLNKYITPELKNDTSSINLYGTTFIGVDVGEDSFNYEKIISIQDLMNSCSSGMYAITYLIIAVCSAPAASSAGATCSNASDCCVNCIICFAIVAGVIVATLILIDFILCIIIYISIQRLKWILTDNAKIGDDVTNYVIQELIKEFSFNYYFALSIMIILAVTVCFGIATFIIYRIKKKSYN